MQHHLLVQACGDALAVGDHQQAGGAAPDAGAEAEANQEVTDVDFEEVK